MSKHIKLERRVWIFRYIREQIGLNDLAYEFYRFKSECCNAIEDTTVRCDLCNKPVNINHSYEWVGKHRIAHKDCVRGGQDG